MATAAMTMALLRAIQWRRGRQVTWKCLSCRNRYWQDRRCTACGWIWNPQGLEPSGQTGAPPGFEAPTEVQDTEMAIPKGRPPKPVSATLDSALARQARAKKNVALVKEEARAEMALEDKAVNEARQLAVQDTVIFADVEVLAQALRLQPQQQALDAAARESLARMTDALTSMRAMQQVQQQGPTPVTPMTPTVTQGSEPFQELQVTQEAMLREAVRQAENTAVGQSPQG